MSVTVSLVTVSSKDAKVGRKTGGITGAMMHCYQLIL